MLFCERFEKHVDRRPTGIALGIGREPEPSIFDPHVQTRWGHDHTRLPDGWQWLAFARVTYPKRRLAIEPVRKGTAERTAKVNDQENGDFEASRKSAQNIDHRGRPAGGSSNRDNVFPRHAAVSTDTCA